MQSASKATSFINDLTSSLFMKYVKQKLVKKIKTDQMPM